MIWSEWFFLGVAAGTALGIWIHARAMAMLEIRRPPEDRP